MSSPQEPSADLSAQKRALFAIRDLKARIEAMEKARREPIAVVGMSCRFPGAADLDEFWRLLDSGGDAIDVVPADRWDVDEFYDPDPEAPGKTYCREGGFIGRVDGFDATLFGISPREVVSMDPQQRLLLEVSWEALEHAGIAPGQIGGSPTGVFVGLSTNDYSGLTVHHPDLTRIDAYMGTGGAACVAAGRISYLLGLHGPALAVDTACSSALVAVEMAVGQLRTGKCDMALAGGVSLMLSPKASVYLSRLRAVSPTNRCHAFAAAADGYVRGEGCGMIVLKRLSDAQRDSDRILAVIRGAALNHDGRSSGLTVPNGAAQEAVIRKALADANVEPAQVQYIEAHGTGTPLGDPIEMRALAEVLGADRQQPFVIGTVKTNIGHLEAAAGIAGLIKVVLAMQHRTIPRSLHFNSPSQHIAWDQVPVTVATTSMPWPNPAALPMAGVSAFGFSGTNAHVILEAAPAADERVAPPVDRPVHLLTISAPNRQGVTDVAVAYARHVDALAGESIMDAAYTANVGRTPFEQRAAVVFASGQELGEQLRTLAAGPGATPDVVTGRALDPDARKLAFLFTGQGAQYAQMGRDLYDASPVFRQAMDDCDAIITERTGRSLLPIVFPTAPDSNAINETGWTQPALFSIEYALAQLWRSWGIEPAVVMGHSLGEYVAACVAGLFDLKDALSLVITRATLMQAMPAGGRMVAVMAPEADVAVEVARVGGALAVAAVNGPSNTVVSGAAAAVEALIAASAARGWTTQALVVSHAFHSPLMDPALAAIGAAAGAVTFRTPTIRIISNLTGTVAQPGALARADYWIDHTRRPVRFADSVKTAAALGCTHFLEIGPHPTLLALAGQTLADGSVKMLPSLRRGGDAWRQMLRSAASLWVDGYPIDWARFDAAYGRQRVALPTYPFQRQRYWVETTPVHVTGAAASSSLLGDRVSSPAFPQTMYQSVVDGESLQILGDHVIYGNPIFPAMGYVALARQAGQAVLGLDSPRVCDLSIEEPLTVPGGERRLMQIVLNKDGDRNATFRVFSRAAEDDSAPWARHATGRVDNGRPEECDQPVDRLRERCPRAIDMSTYYEELSERGLAYGPSFRAIESMWAGEGEAIARLRMPIAAAPGYDAHPGYLDAALQVLGALFAGAGQQSGGDVFLPVGIPQLAIAQPLPATVTSYARLQGTFDPKADVLKADVFWIDESGVTVLSAPGIVVKRASGAAVKRAAEKRVRQWMHHVVWEPAAVDTDNGQTGPASYLVVGTSSGDGGAVVRALKDRGHNAVLVDVVSESAATVGRELERVMKADATSRLRVVAYVAGDRTQGDKPSPQDALARALVADALTIVQACSHPSGDRSQVYFVTRGGQAAGAAPYDVAPAQAALWGFARSARLEHPELACVSVDLDPSGVRDNVSALADELTSRSHEDQVAYRGGSRLAARLVQGDGRALTDAPLAVPDAPSFRLSTTGRGVLDNLTLEPQERRQPGAGEVEIEVEAAGVNFRDVLNALGMYPGDPGPMGGECAGRVVSVGAGVTTLRVGDDVFCLAGGSFSRFVVAQERAVARRPAALTAVQASSLPLTFLTVYHGLHHLAGIKPGQRVLVHAAAGGVGLSAIQVARAAGAEVYGTAGSPEKQDYVRSLGVKAVFSSRTADFEAGLMAATGGEGVDIVLNSLTGEFIPASLRVLRKGGTFLEIGKAEIWTGAQLAAVNPHVHYKPFDLGDVILTDLDRIASMFKDVLAGLGTGALGPLPVRVFDMTDARSAFRFMAQARHFGKIVLRAPRLKPDAGAFAITGGTGGLGLRVAQHLVERGTRHLVLAGRSEPGAGPSAAIDEMRSSGAQVSVVRADVGTPEGVRSVLSAVDAMGVRLSGVVHAAGVLDDGLIRDQTPERVARVMSSKATGAWLLDEMTRERSPEHFVLFSSVASLLGSPGQSNYAAANAFLDGLAHRRHADGRPATSINWGAWAEIGMAARVHGGAGRLEDSGFGTIAPDLGLTALDLAMSADVAQVGVFPASWDKVLARFASGSEPAFLRTLAKETAHRSTGSGAGDSGASLTSRLEAVPEAERNDLILAFVRQRVARVIGVENGDGLDPLVPFTNLGVDSLMAVEMRNALASSLGRQLPPSLIYDYPNISTLAAFVASELIGPSSSNQAAARAPGADEADKWEDAASRLDELSEREMADLLAAQLGALGGGEDPAR